MDTVNTTTTGFDNTVKAEWIEGEKRKMLILETINFTDKNGKVWTAPATTKTTRSQNGHRAQI